MTEKELIEKVGVDVECFIQMQINNLAPILKSRNWTPPEERGKQNKEWFEKGKNSVLRKNQSGCCCIINDNDEIVSLCSAHQEHFEEYIRVKGWTPPHGYDTSSGVCEVCDQLNSDKMRSHGWFHKDDPIPKLHVVMECSHTIAGLCDIQCDYSDEMKCNLNGYILRSLTVSELLEMVEGMVEVIPICNNCTEVHCEKSFLCGHRKALTTKDGGRIVREEG